MKRRILFVDDEPDILHGLKRLLRPFRNEYDMEFVDSGRKALELLSESDFDVIVSDLRMPGMDGSELLNRVQQEHPNVVRLILSGQADRETVMNCVEATHQYLSKPCDSELLKSTITRACALRDLLSDEELTRVVSGVQKLPSLPAIYNQVMQELRDPDASLNAIGILIEQDVAMSAKILKLVNSSFFGMRREVASPSQAASLLGVDLVKSLVLSVGVFSEFDDKAFPGFSLEELMQHSLRVADLAKRIAVSETDDRHMHNEAYLAGLMHGVGKLVLAGSFPDQFREVIETSVSEGMSTAEAELQILGVTHAQIGAYLLGLWGLSDEIVEAVAFHHEPSTCPVPEFRPLAAVHIANCLCRESCTENVAEPPPQLDHEFLAEIGVLDAIESFRSMLNLEVCEVAA